MTVVAIILNIFLAVALAFSAVGKLTKMEQPMQAMHAVKFPDDKVWMLAAVEIAGAVGLVIGIFWTPLAILAAIGVVLYFIGAVIAHLRVKDTAYAPAAFLGVLALIAVVVNSIAA